MIDDPVAFLTISLLVIVTPGQDTALIIRNTLRGNRRAGVATAFGVATALAAWTTATSAGLTALLLASAPLFHALKVAGAVYLVILGGQALRAALWPSQTPAERGGVNPRRLLPPAIAFRQGLVSNLGNPKIAVFFTSFLPQFAPHDEHSFRRLFLLGLVFCALTLVWLVGYAIAVARAASFLRRPRITRALDAIMGTVFIALGVRLATATR